MQTRPLTRSEAIARAEIIEVESYAIEIDLRGCDVGRGTFGSQTLVKFSCSRPGASTFAEFRSNEPAKAELNGREVAVVDGRIPLDGLQEHNELRVSGQGMFSTAGEGLHRAVDPADGAVYVYSMCFLHDASRVFACFDQPDLKATFQLIVQAPDGWKVVSNSPAVEGTAWRFEATPKLPTYLVALAAGPYASAHLTWTPPNGGPEVPLGLYCRKSMEPYLEADDVFATTRAGLQFYTNQFGVAFPFVKYDQLFAPEFNAG
ncbi:MAG: aminopeptidase N, partial [Candidatus Nanopelagicales bacterium]